MAGRTIMIGIILRFSVNSNRVEMMFERLLSVRMHKG